MPCRAAPLNRQAQQKEKTRDGGMVLDILSN
jgi:hypothetical protein